MSLQVLEGGYLPRVYTVHALELCVTLLRVMNNMVVCFRERGTHNINVTPALKCMANDQFRALQLHYRYSDSQCLEDISNIVEHQ